MFHLSFGGKVVLYDPYLKDLATWHLSVNPDDLRRVSSIDEICETADIISIHVPLTAETNNCISTRQFELMKSSAILINSARGGIVDEAALQVALESGEIFGAGLDAFVSEPPSSAAYAGLCKLPNVVMT
jgi:D-3-phosphoglycerate dehydrogenase